MEFARIEIQPALPVMDEGIVVVGVPERLHHGDEFACPLITLGMRRQLVEAEVARRIIIGRCHDIPGGAAVAEMIQRCEQPGEVIGFVEAGGGSCAEPDMGRRRRDGRQQRDGFEDVHEHREPAPGVQVLGPCRGRVGDEEEVEEAPLGKLCGPGVIADVGRRIRGRVGLQPGGRMRACPLDQHCQSHLRHGWSFRAGR